MSTLGIIILLALFLWVCLPEIGGLWFLHDLNKEHRGKYKGKWYIKGDPYLIKDVIVLPENSVVWIEVGDWPGGVPAEISPTESPGGFYFRIEGYVKPVMFLQFWGNTHALATGPVQIVESEGIVEKNVTVYRASPE